MTAPTTRTLGLDDWMTPPEVFNPLHAVLNFDLDACATDARSARVPRFISPEQNALVTPWDGERVWVNPPYGRDIHHWVKRAAEAPRRDFCTFVAMLIYANTDTRYWRDYVVNHENTFLVVFLSPRVRFVRVDGQEAKGAPKGSALVLYTQNRRRRNTLTHGYWNWKTQDQFPWWLLDHAG